MEQMKNRRDFIKKVSLVSAAGLFANKSIFANMSEIKKVTKVTNKKIGLQIYSLGKELYEDVPAGLKKIANMGYSTLELAGYKEGKINNIDMSEFRKMADDAGLKIVSSHLNPPIREYTNSNRSQISEFWKKASEDHAKIGVKYIIQPGQPSTRSVEEVSLVSEVFNDAGRIAKGNGLIFGYHNHEMEFSKVVPGGKEMVFGRKAFGNNAPEGLEVVYDGLLRQTDPNLVIFELDVYWAVMGQNDPLEYMRKYPNRIRLLHIKDKAVLGQSGMMNFEQIFNQAYKNGIDEYYVEIEGITSGSQFEGVRGCVDYLIKAPFVK